jgi:hypothetical protein
MVISVINGGKTENHRKPELPQATDKLYVTVAEVICHYINRDENIKLRFMDTMELNSTFVV